MESTAVRFAMTYQAPGGTLAPWAQLLETAGRYFLGVVARHAQARKARATLHELQSLGARQLADIGLTRADVDFSSYSVARALRACACLATTPRK